MVIDPKKLELCLPDETYDALVDISHKTKTPFNWHMNKALSFYVTTIISKIVEPPTKSNPVLRDIKPLMDLVPPMFKSKFEERLKHFAAYHFELGVLSTQSTAVADETLPSVHLDISYNIFDIFLPSVATAFNVTVSEIMSKSRLRDVTDARKFLFWLMYTCGNTHAYGGQRLGFRNHATSIHNCRAFENMFSIDKVYRSKVIESVKSVLNKGVILPHNVHALVFGKLSETKKYYK